MVEVRQTPARRARSLFWLPLIVSVGALATAIPLGWSRSFGAFLIIYMIYAPVIFVLCLVLAFRAIAERRSRGGRAAGPALLALLVLTPAALYGVPLVRDDVGYFFWATTHPGTLREFAGRNAVIMGWDSWGLAGMGNDSYLVSNPDGELDDPSKAAKWLSDVGSDCEIVRSKRMARALYIVTTYECPLW